MHIWVRKVWKFWAVGETGAIATVAGAARLPPATVNLRQRMRRRSEGFEEQNATHKTKRSLATVQPKGATVRQREIGSRRRPFSLAPDQKHLKKLWSGARPFQAKNSGALPRTPALTTLV
jgi:hypothetical protein